MGRTTRLRVVDDAPAPAAQPRTADMPNPYKAGASAEEIAAWKARWGQCHVAGDRGVRFWRGLR